MHFRLTDNRLPVDAELTQRGYIEASLVEEMWTKELAADIGLPSISYCSPLTRCLETNSISFGQSLQIVDPFKKAKQTGDKQTDDAKIKTTVLEVCLSLI